MFADRDEDGAGDGKSIDDDGDANEVDGDAADDDDDSGAVGDGLAISLGSKA